MKEVTIYVSDDGMDFESRDSCIEHEEAYYVNKIPHTTVGADVLFDGSDCNLYVFFKVDTVDDAELLFSWAKRHATSDSNIVDDFRVIGQTIVADCYNGTDDTIQNISDVYALETLQDNIQRYINRLYEARDAIPLCDFYRDKEKKKS